MDLKDIESIKYPELKEVDNFVEEYIDFDVKKRGRVYFGFEPSGVLHKGHLVQLFVLNALAARGWDSYILVANYHAELNGKTIHSYDAIKKYLNPNVKIIEQRDILTTKWLDVLSELSQKITFNRCKRAIDCAGRDETETIKMSSLLYAMLQAVDIKMLDVDLVIGGIDQRKVHMLVRDTFKKLKWKVPGCIHTKILLGKDGNKMSSSNPKYCELI